MAIVLNFGALSIATTYSFSGPTTGLVGIDTADFSVTPNGPYVGTITVRVSMNSFPVGISPIVLSWNGTFETQRFSFVAPFAGTYALDATNNGSLIDASELLCLIGNPYYVSTTGSGGDGSLGNPWGPAELQVLHGSGTTAWHGPGVAITNLQPGDTLYFRTGTYDIQGVPYNQSSVNSGNGMLYPSRSGTAMQRITIRNYPGEAVTLRNISSTPQPIFGGTANYIRYLGLTIIQNTSALFGVDNWYPIPGTATVTNGSASVSLAGGTFDGKIVAGYWMWFSTDGTKTPYLVSIVNDSTHLTLSTTYAGTGSSSATINAAVHAISTAFLVYGSNNEIAYCDIGGATWTHSTGDNYDGIVLEKPGTNNWIHHNVIHGFVDTDVGGLGLGSPNGAGFKTYYSGVTTVEDNYTYGSTFGFFDKGATDSDQADLYHQTTYRRNYIADDFLGCQQVKQGVIHFYDNIVPNSLNLAQAQLGSQYYNNLLLSLNSANPYDAAHGLWAFYNLSFVDSGTSPAYQIQVWNNVVIPAAPNANITPLLTGNSDIKVTTDPTCPWSYSDYNVYCCGSGVAHYDFGTYGQTGSHTALSSLTQSDMAPYGMEQNSTIVASATTVYVDTTDYVLQTAYQTAGRYGDCVGPGISTPSVPAGSGVITVAQILDTTRYGPAAIGSYV